MNKLEFPACYDSREQWASWWALLRDSVRSSTKQKAIIHFCQDCTLSYQAKMISEGRCAYPDTTFNGEIVNTPNLSRSWPELYYPLEESELSVYRGTLMHVGNIDADKQEKKSPLCLICSKELKNHLRCKECGILIGPDHYDQYIVEDYCIACYKLKVGVV